MKSLESVREEIAKLESLAPIEFNGESKPLTKEYKQAQKRVVKLRAAESILMSGLSESVLLKQKREQEVLEQNLEDGFEDWKKNNPSVEKELISKGRKLKPFYEKEVGLNAIRNKISMINFVLAD